MSISTSDLSLTNSISSNQAAKTTTGTVIPNRIFVGGIAPETTDSQLKEFFASHGAVKDTKIICDRAGASKGYGFVTFETQEDADKIINKDSTNLIFKERKLNIGPAVRKQQLYPRLLDGLPSGSSAAAAAMFLTSAGAYSYATPGGLAMMTSEGYQHALHQQQMQSQVAAPNYSNMIVPAQIPMYLPQPSYPYSATTPIQNPAAAPTIPYGGNAVTNGQWIPNPRCLQTPAATCATPSPIYPDSLMYATANSASPAVPAQYLDVSEGTMHENNNNDVESRCSSAQTSADTLLNTGQVVTSVMSVQQQGRPVHQHFFHGNTSPQPPPIKKMAHMPHYAAGDAAVRCFNAPFVAGNMKPALMPTNVCSGNRAPNMAIMPAGHHDIRLKFEHDRLTNSIANIAPPTPPTTPAGGSNN